MQNNFVWNIELIINEYTAYVYKIIDNTSAYLSQVEKEEIASDVFYLLWKNQEKITTNLKSYLAKIAKNCTYAYLRKEKNTVDYQEEFSYEEKNTMEDMILLKQKLASLSIEEIKTFELFYVYGYKIKEIANLLHLSIPTVKVRLFRLRKKLKEENK